MPRAKKQQRESIDLTVDTAANSAGPSSAAAAIGGFDVLDLTQDDDANVGAGPSAAPPTGSVVPAAKPRRKRSAAAVDAQAAGAAAAQADGAAVPAPAGKKRKVEKKEKAPKKEKEKRQNAFGRTVPWSAKPSQKVQERMARAMPGSGHRLFLISRKTEAPVGADGGPVEEFVVLGATGSVYTVKVGRHPSCSCPDHAKGNLCKHQLFVNLRVLRLAQDDPLVWQRALLKAEMAISCSASSSQAQLTALAQAEEVLSGARSQRNADMHVHASDAVQRAWRAASGGAADEQEAAGSDVSTRTTEGAECAICFDELTDGASAAQRAIATCTSCGNHLHKECFAKWAAAKQGSVTCPYCRSAWAVPAAAAGAGPSAAGGYMNLSQYSEDHRNTQSLEDLYGATAVWINHHARGGNARHALRVYNRLR